MKLENQVCSLELAKRLKELGVKQKSYCYWVMSTRAEQVWDATMMSDYSGPENPSTIASAFTVAELGEMLPSGVMTGNSTTDYEIKKGKVACVYDLHYISQFADTEANARAKMLCYLLENKLLTLL